MKRHTTEKDGISNLPAHILHHILSFLSQEEAVKTCVLSKSWHHLVSTRPKFQLVLHDFDRGKEKFMYVLNKSLQVYYDQKLFIEDFRVSMSNVDPDLESLLEKWVPILIHEMGVKKFDLSIGYLGKRANLVKMPSAVFESESLQELFLERCNLSQINSVGKHLKTLHLCDVYIKEETFGKITSSCSLIQRLGLRYCEGLTTINMHNHPNLKSFELYNNKDGTTEIYLPSIIECISIYRNPNWFRNRNYFPCLTCLYLDFVPLSNGWFDSFSRNFPCLEDLRLLYCHGFNRFRLSSHSIKNLDITMDQSTTRATIDAPSIKMFHCEAKISQSISFSTTSGSIWKSQIRLLLDLDAKLWFLKISELVVALSQSQISLVLSYFGSGNQLFSVCCCGGSYKKMAVAIESLELNLDGLYYDSFFSDLMNGLFRIIRPREINQVWHIDAQENDVIKFLCTTLQLGRWEDQSMSFWQQDLEGVSLEVKKGADSEEWYSVQGTINWSEYVAALHSDYKLRFRLKWRKFTS